MNKQKEMTARTSSVGADERQSLNVSVNSIAAYHLERQSLNVSVNSIAAYHLKINTFILKGGGMNG